MIIHPKLLDKILKNNAKEIKEYIKELNGVSLIDKIKLIKKIMTKLSPFSSASIGNKK